MDESTVLVAPIVAEVLASILAQPSLLTEVAFGARQRVLDVPAGTPVYLYVAPDYSGHRALVRPGFVTWMGRLGSVVPAVSTGPRRGMHPDPVLRPPFAEAYDYHDAALFWHVEGLSPLKEPVPIDRFRDTDGAPLFGGLAPQWLSRATLAEPKKPAGVRLLRAA